MSGLKLAGSSSNFGEGLIVVVVSVIVRFPSLVELAVPNKVVWHS